jgi:Protein of unknown function (DUF3421).
MFLWLIMLASLDYVAVGTLRKIVCVIECMICFQVLTGCEVEWVPASGGQVPDRALPSGETEDGEPLFIGRISHDGTMTLGKVYCYMHFVIHTAA